MESRQPIREIVHSNVHTAIEIADQYGGLEGAFEAFMMNTEDHCIEEGYTPEEAFEAKNWFCHEFNIQTGMSF